MGSKHGDARNRAREMPREIPFSTASQNRKRSCCRLQLVVEKRWLWSSETGVSVVSAEICFFRGFCTPRDISIEIEIIWEAISLLVGHAERLQNVG